MADEILYEPSGHRAVFRLNRPERRNALTTSMRATLQHKLDLFAEDSQMRVGILTGSGDAFCAGADLQQRHEQYSAGKVPVQDGVGTGIGPFSACPKPVIAAVNGVCIGGGLELAADCDIRICSTEATFALFEVKRGFWPGRAIHHLYRVIGYEDALYLMLTGDRIGAGEALRIGLVREVVPAADLLPRAEAIAAMIAGNAPLAVTGIKAVAQTWRNRGLDASMAEARRLGPAIRGSDDAKEGVRAFVEKRAPEWKGR